MRCARCSESTRPAQRRKQENDRGSLTSYIHLLQKIRLDLPSIKKRLQALEPQLASQPGVDFETFQTPHGPLRLVVTERLRKKCKKEGVWKAPAMLTALKNASYGFDATAPRSRGGSDGIFSLDRSFKPANAMMAKMYARFLDKPDPLVAQLQTAFDAPAPTWTAVRLVSHHMRLLGVLFQSQGICVLVLVDCDREKGQ